MVIALRAENYRVYPATEWFFAPPSVNWDGTGSLLDRALTRLRQGGILEVGVVGYSHGAAISRRVIQRLSNERNPIVKGDLWNVTYSAYIDAIQREFFDYWPLVVAEKRGPVFQGSGQHWHDNFYQSTNIDVVNNTMCGAFVPGADNGADDQLIGAVTHTSIDDEARVKNEILRQIGLRVRQ